VVGSAWDPLRQARIHPFAGVIMSDEELEVRRALQESMDRREQGPAR